MQIFQHIYTKTSWTSNNWAISTITDGSVIIVIFQHAASRDHKQKRVKVCLTYDRSYFFIKSNSLFFFRSKGVLRWT